MKKTSQVLMAVGAAGLVVAGGAAYTAGVNVNDSFAGVGDAAVNTAVSVSNIDWKYNGTADGSGIIGVAFDSDFDVAVLPPTQYWVKAGQMTAFVQCSTGTGISFTQYPEPDTAPGDGDHDVYCDWHLAPEVQTDVVDLVVMVAGDQP